MPPIQLIAQTAQFRHWHFPSENVLEEARIAAHERALAAVHRERVEEDSLRQAAREPPLSPNGQNPSVPSESPPSVDDERALVAHWTRWVHGAAQRKSLRFPIRVEATAMAFVRRFYLRRSVMEYPPKHIAATALFLASKTENHYISIERYAAALATECDIPDLDGRTIVQLEYTLADTICFHLAVHHPLTALHGIFLDAQAYVAEERHAMLLSAYRAAAAPAAMVDVLADTDLYFLCHPSQIAMAMFCRAYDRQVDVRFANGGDAQGLVEGVANSTVDADADAHSFTASYIRKRFAKEDPSHLDELLLKITAIYQHLDAIPSRHPDPLAMKLIEERAAYWRLPSLDPQSRVYATRQHGDEEHEMREVLPTSSTTATTRTDRRRSTVAQELDDVFE